MNLSHDSLKELTALAELKSEGGIVDRHFLQLKSHVINDHHRVDESSFDGRRVARGVLLGMGWFVGLITPKSCLLYTSPSPRDQRGSRMPSSA